MSSSIINNSYFVGVAGRNLVLQTLGRVYVQVKDKYYELKFEGIRVDGNILVPDENKIVDIVGDPIQVFS